ncbi:MAG: chloride channel protein [Leptospiraceae bacterium]|nr:chloride channel protein [Leptospiraceae bacterium]
MLGYSYLKNLFKITGHKSLYFYSMIVGIVSGLTALFFSWLLACAEFIIQFKLAGLKQSHPAGEFFITSNESLVFNPYIFFFLPILGGLLCGILTHFFCNEAAGAGMDSTIHAFHQKEGKMNPKLPFYKFISTIITLSSGGSGGKEGPIAQIGAGFGSTIASWMGAGARARRTLLLAGMAGGIGAIFHSPLGGALTAVESLYKEDIESDSLISCIISSVTAYLIYSSVTGFHSIYKVREVSFTNMWEIFFYILLGLSAYYTGVIFINIFHKIQSKFSKMSLPSYLKPALGAIPVACIGIFFPQVLGSGAGLLQEIIDKGSAEQISSNPYLVFLLFLFFAFLKILTTSFTVASGGSAGIFAPSLFIGGMLGGAIGTIAQIVSGNDISIPSFMLVGMSAFYSGVSSAPIAGMVMICEMIGSYKLLPPLMIVTIITFLLSGNKISIFKNQLENRFVSPAHYWDMNLDILERTKIKDVFSEFRKIAAVPKKMLVTELEEFAPEIKASDFIVTDEKGFYYGIFSLRKNRLDETLRTIAPTLVTVEDATNTQIPYVQLTDTVSEAHKIMLQYDIDKIAVVEDEKFLGYIRISDIIRVYSSITSKKKAS